MGWYHCLHANYSPPHFCYYHPIDLSLEYCDGVMSLFTLLSPPLFLLETVAFFLNYRYEDLLFTLSSPGLHQSLFQDKNQKHGFSAMVLITLLYAWLIWSGSSERSSEGDPTTNNKVLSWTSLSGFEATIFQHRHRWPRMSTTRHPRIILFGEFTSGKRLQ